MEFPPIAIRSLLLFLFLTSCSSPKAKWEASETGTKHTPYKAFRITQKPDNVFRGMELEFVCTSSGLRSYLNIFSLKFPNNSIECKKTKISIHSNDQTIEFLANRLEGDQRLLIPFEAQSFLIHQLSKSNSVKIMVGRFEVEISPDDFVSYLPKLNHFASARIY